MNVKYQQKQIHDFKNHKPHKPAVSYGNFINLNLFNETQKALNGSESQKSPKNAGWFPLNKHVPIQF